MELFIIGFCLAVCGTWLYLAKDYSHNKLATAKIQMLMNQNLELKKQLKDQEETCVALRTTFMNYKSSWTNDLREVQVRCEKISESQKRVSKSQLELEARVDARPIEISIFDNPNKELKTESQFKKIKSQLKGLSQ